MKSWRFVLAVVTVAFCIFVAPIVGWTEWMLEEYALGILAMLAIGLCFPVYFGLKPPPRQE